MRIGIDARMMGKGAGIARYVEQLVLALGKIDSETEYILFVNSSSRIPELGNNFRLVFCDIPWYSLEEQTKLIGILDRENLDLLHFPHWNVPLLYKKPFVITVHDLIMYHFPRAEATTLGPLKYFFKDRIHRVVLNHACRKAQRIFVTSEFTKNDLHQTLKVLLEKMVVTYQAPFETHASVDMQRRASLLQKYKVQEPYILYVGSAYPHKNLENLLRAWKIFKQRDTGGYTLVLVGKRSAFYERLIQMKEMQEGHDVIYTDFLEDEDLELLYQGASLYAFPSYYEGFGLPPLEAMAKGVPVVSSSATCLPEVLGDAALYFDPKSPENMASIIEKALTDEDIRLDLQIRAKEILMQYSWEKLAKTTVKGYHEIFSQLSSN
ncbi:MAG: hypothetical protein COV59_04885 [Candidatus Magasanikbacteria bacterium CG11_big_fil_rev_8_21_14_0_20_39_34]|uniref:Glycosyl transferase family 1 n=1 Tax=Candidatus Magasanikbacteria bacterium CG11_big_fil_rev_8_21_14_0_20_39_34 TaxID=1974653 RepID=A0A2H0N3P2_9BACT|nr:MAG: hypothetical protein COV59_04885 [Candidatus Magasanikbacteria bacterium CG11_big_fil_rev_8_21_14_0_20_39_34]